MKLKIIHILRWFSAAFYDNPLMAAMSPNRGSIIRAIGYLAPLMIVAGMGFAIEGDDFISWVWSLTPENRQGRFNTAMFLGLLIILSLSALIMLVVSLYSWLIYGKYSFQKIRLPVTHQLTPVEILAGLHIWPASMAALGAAASSIWAFVWIKNILIQFITQAGAQGISKVTIVLVSLGCVLVMFVLFSIMYCMVQWVFPANRSFRPWGFIGSLTLVWATVWCIARIFHAIIIHLEDYHFMCFAGNAAVESPSGSIPISQIQSGQPVVARNLWTGEFQSSAVAKVTAGAAARIVDVRLDNGETISSTQEHRWRVRGLGWIASKRLMAGDVLIGLNGNSPRILSIIERECEGETPVYTINVGGPRNYFIGQSKVLVHNKTIK